MCHVSDVVCIVHVMRGHIQGNMFMATDSGKIKGQRENQQQKMLPLSGKSLVDCMHLSGKLCTNA